MPFVLLEFRENGNGILGLLFNFEGQQQNWQIDLEINNIK